MTDLVGLVLGRATHIGWYMLRDKREDYPFLMGPGWMADWFGITGLLVDFSSESLEFTRDKIECPRNLPSFERVRSIHFRGTLFDRPAMAAHVFSLAPTYIGDTLAEGMYPIPGYFELQRKPAAMHDAYLTALKKSLRVTDPSVIFSGQQV